MPRARVKLNSPGMGKLLGSPGVESALKSEANKVMGRAKAAAPRRTGSLSDSHEVRVDKSRGGRARARVVATADHAAIVASRTGYLGAALGGK